MIEQKGITGNDGGIEKGCYEKFHQMEGAHGSNVKAPGPKHVEAIVIENKVLSTVGNPQQDYSTTNVQSPDHPQETTKDPHSAQALFWTIDVDEFVVQKFQCQDGLDLVHESADGLELFDNLLHAAVE